jgi:hypothetical protein
MVAHVRSEPAAKTAVTRPTTQPMFGTVHTGGR